MPLLTWVIGSAALVVILAAGALFLGGEAGESPEEASAEEPKEPTEPADSAAVTAPKNPLDISSIFVDAQERSRIWSPKAMLAGLELVVENGAPTGPITFEFGEAMSAPVPLAPLSPRRQMLSYRGTDVSETARDSTTGRVALPEPNCPLEVAFRKLRDGGTATSGRVGVLYAFSTTHNRPVWIMTNEDGKAVNINADTCALLTR